jgi:hypothetical protein
MSFKKDWMSNSGNRFHSAQETSTLIAGFSLVVTSHEDWGFGIARFPHAEDFLDFSISTENVNVTAANFWNTYAFGDLEFKRGLIFFSSGLTTQYFLISFSLQTHKILSSKTPWKIPCISVFNRWNNHLWRISANSRKVGSFSKSFKSCKSCCNIHL